MSQAYPFTVSAAFPNAKVSVPVLQNQIKGSEIATTLEGVVRAADTCTATFEAALSGADETTLNGLVAAHQGNPYAPSPLSGTSEAVEEASSMAPLDKVSIAANLPPGDYNIFWSCDLKSSSTMREIFLNITVNDVVIRQAIQVVRVNGWMSLSGLSPLTITLATAGLQTIKLQYGCAVKGMSAFIRDGVLKVQETE